jgi:arabinose-5-phosphate isomerase
MIAQSPPQTTSETNILTLAYTVFEAEIEALKTVQSSLDEAFEQAVLLLEHATGRVVITGMGKSGHIGKKIAATFASLGTPAFFLHPAEGLHGDLGMVSPGDVVIALSKSGESTEVLEIIPTLKHLNVPIIAMTSNTASSLSRAASVTLNMGVTTEACQLNLAPTSSTTVSLVLGDALAVVLSTRKGFTANDFALFHPAGSLGKRLLLTVESVMHTGDAIPVVQEETLFTDALIEMTAKKLGMTLVVNAENRVTGIITDGDVRRILSEKLPSLPTLRVSDIASKTPKSIAKTELAATALALMEQYAITTVWVAHPDGSAEGVLHLHDLLKTGL